MLGSALQRVLAAAGSRFVARSVDEMDITDPAQVAEQFDRFVAGLREGESGVVVNAAAYTDVERAEDEPELAYRVNEGGAGQLARCARERGLRFVHVSTDFVFDGRKQGAYTETDDPAPLSVYGASKLAGEQAVLAADPEVLMVRTAWVFGPGGVNFPSKILAAARERGALKVVDDEIGSPTFSVDLATGIIALVEAGAVPGTYHLAGSGSASRYDLALEVLGAAGVEVPVERASSAQFPTRAARPRNSVLDCSKAAEQGVRLPRWEHAVRRFIRAERGER